MDLADRVVGSALGLALGDALGAPFEFLRARNVPDPIPALERPWLSEPPGSTTDDTAMARNLMRSLAAQQRFDPDDLLERHLEWFRSDPPDVGTLTGRVLRRIAAGEDAATAAQEIWNERGPEVSAGNGSVMYCAPLGLAYANRPDELGHLAPALSALTHVDGRCMTAVLAVTLGVAALVRGERAERRSPSSADCRRRPRGRGGARVPGRSGRRFASDRRARSGLLPLHRGGRLPGPPPPGRRRDRAPARRLARRRHRHQRGGGRRAPRRPRRRERAARRWLERLRDAEAIRADAEALVPLADTH